MLTPNENEFSNFTPTKLKSTISATIDAMCSTDSLDALFSYATYATNAIEALRSKMCKKICHEQIRSFDESKTLSDRFIWIVGKERENNE